MIKDYLVHLLHFTDEKTFREVKGPGQRSPTK